MSETAIGLLKAYGANPLAKLPSLSSLISSWIKDKEFNPEVVMRLSLAGVFGRLMSHYFMGTLESNIDEDRHVINNIGRNLIHYGKRTDRLHGLDRYNGERSQNFRIDHAFSESFKSATRFGQGSANRFTISVAALSLPTPVRQVPIVIIGNGAAGILVKRTLSTVGFDNVTVFEKSSSLGIWNNKNVYERSRNNPVALSWRDTILQSAPGDGASVREFLRNLNSEDESILPVKSVQPSQLNHKLEFFGTTPSQQYPIVINCSGLGIPRPLSDDDRMTTNTSQTEAGERWQKTLDIGACQRKRFAFIGLGNSTAEMIRQIHDFQDKGAEIDYRIMTHYPADSVNNPEDVIEDSYRVFRDISVPNLTSWQGDLSASRYDYFRALRTGKIISSVRSWSRRKNSIVCTGALGRRTHFSADHLYTLIGYHQPESYLTSQGIKVSGEDGCPLLDYDGEVQTGLRNSRLHHGYFAFGAIAANPQDKNAVVIPGMLFRLYDLVTSAVIRAAEYSLPSLS